MTSPTLKPIMAATLPHKTSSIIKNIFVVSNPKFVNSVGDNFLNVNPSISLHFCFSLRFFLSLSISSNKVELEIEFFIFNLFTSFSSWRFFLLIKSIALEDKF